ncbi:hypothetical protein SpCBS45565_g07419 [Spizellomyces sp. 'palustris']|nr:hypothetical protein SpCBS45565_g07419 [Spizellomyces sp. 'palustris']
MSFSDPIDWDAVLDFPQESLDNQIKGVDEHKLLNRLHKTDEEIERYIVDESLDDIDRTIHLLRNGAAIQKQSVIGMLPKLLQEHNSEMRSRVLPVLLDSIPNEHHSLRIAAGRMMIQLMESGLLPPKTVQSVAAAAKKVIDRKDPGTAEVWEDVLIMAIQFMPLDVVENEILPEALIDGALAQPSPYRLWCARVLGAAAPRIEGKKSQELFFRKAMQLCQDTDYEVRACMCRQLNAIAKAVGLDLTTKELLPEYVELILDEESVVREAAIANIMQLVNVLDGGTKASVIVPVWKKLCEERAPRLLTCLARELGILLWETRDLLPEADLRYFTTFYQSLSTSSVSETREMCAFNFPAIVNSLGNTQAYETHGLDSVYDKLIHDTNARVRRRMASGLHAVAEILGSRSWTLLKTGFLKLFGDGEVEVYHQLFKHLGQILVQFAKDDACRKDTQLDDLLFLILRRERECAINSARFFWRTHHDLLEQFRWFPDVFGPDLLYGHCVPLLFKLLSENVVLPIKHTAMKTLCITLRKTKRWEHRDRLCRQMQDLKDATNCHTRLLFLDLCEAVLSVFSHKFFKENFLPSYLELVKDPVPNVRLRLVSLLPAVRRTLHLPADSALLQRVSEAVGTLLTADPDRDVTEAASAILSKLGAPASEHVINSGKRAMFGADTLSRSQDSLDKQKEEEEQRAFTTDWDTEEVVRRRDMDDARQEFAKRLADKDLTKKGKIKPGGEGSSATVGAKSRNTGTGPAGNIKPRGTNTMSKSGEGASGGGLYSSNWATLGDRRASGTGVSASSTGNTGVSGGPGGRPIGSSLRSAVMSTDKSSAGPGSSSTVDSPKRVARLASTSAHSALRRQNPRDLSDDNNDGRLPGLGSTRAGLTSPRVTRRPSGGGQGGQGGPTSPAPYFSNSTKTSGAIGSSPASLLASHSMASKLTSGRRSQELLSSRAGSSSTGLHGSGPTGAMLSSYGAASTTQSGAWTTTSGSGSNRLYGSAKSWGKPSPLSPLPKAGGAREGSGDSNPSGSATVAGNRYSFA